MFNGFRHSDSTGHELTAILTAGWSTAVSNLRCPGDAGPDARADETAMRDLVNRIRRRPIRLVERVREGPQLF
jgi:hypothetical protein